MSSIGIDVTTNMNYINNKHSNISAEALHVVVPIVPESIYIHCV